MNAANKQPAGAGDLTSRSGQVATPGAATEAGVRAGQGRAGSPQAGTHAGTGLPAGTTHTATPDEGRTWRIEFPAQQELLASNQSQQPMRVHRIGTQIKNDAIKLCRILKIPHLERAAFVLEYQPPTKGRPIVKDTHNLSGTAKAAIDGCIKAGVLTDDSDRYVANVSYRPGRKHPGGRIVLHVIEVLNPSEHPS